MGGGQSRTGEGAEEATREEQEGRFEAQHEEARLTALRVDFSTRARVGLEALSAHVEAEFGSGVEERVMARIDAAIAMPARFPSIGHTRQDLGVDSSVRFWSVSTTLIAYTYGGGTLRVLLVERGERDWNALLEVSDE